MLSVKYSAKDYSFFQNRGAIRLLPTYLQSYLQSPPLCRSLWTIWIHSITT